MSVQKLLKCGYDHFSQSRTRERLVNLLTCFGQRVGLPKSPSVSYTHYYGFFFYLSCLSLLWVTLTSCSSQVTHFNMFPFVFISHTAKFTVHDKIQITFTRYVWTLSRSACVCVNVWAAACVCARRKIFKFQSIFQIVVFNWLLCEVDYYLMQSVRGQLKCYVPSSCFPLWHKCLKYR